MRWNKQARWMPCLAGAILISAFTGCQRDEARVYHIPKDDSSPDQTAPAAQPQSTQPEMASPDSAPLPQLKYTLPEGWQEKPPSEMRVASFSALGPGGQTADVSVIPLPIVGRDMELVNMWRSQVQLPPTTDPGAVNQAKPVAVGSDQGRLFEYVSEKPMIGKGRQRILIAMLTQGTMSWFFKMSGEDEFVTSQKEKFLQFLKSVSFVDNGSGQMAAAPATPSDNESSPSIWTVPPGWLPVKPSQFLLAEFSISGANGAKAEVNVAELDGEGGGLLANVNRWRGQLGLAVVGDNDLPRLTQSLDVPGGKATLVDFSGMDPKTGATARLVGAVVSLSGQTWFYKLMGDEAIVAQQKDKFTKFIQSANYANAR